MTTFLIVPRVITKNTGSTAVALYSTTLSVPGFIVTASPANTSTVFIGGANVAASVANGIALAPGASFRFDPFDKVRSFAYDYNLNKFFVDAAATETVAVTILNCEKNNPNP